MYILGCRSRIFLIYIHYLKKSIQVSEWITNALPTLLKSSPTYELQLCFPEYKLIPAFPLSLYFLLIILELQECLLRQEKCYKIRYTQIRTEGALLSRTFCSTLLLDCGYLFQLLLPANSIPTVAEILLLSGLLMQHRFLAPME